VEARKLRLDIKEKDLRWAKELLQKRSVKQGKPIIGILPGAGASWGKEARYRRWAPEKYAKLVDKMIEKLSANIILMGDKNEEELCRKLESRHGETIVKAYGQTSLGQLSALLSLCDLVVLNDGGPLHVAVAIGTKTVSIFGPVDHNVYGPYGDPQKHLIVTKDLICQPCYLRFRVTQCSHISCLEQITVDDVFRKVEQLL
jgi:ADP-heptose:LPS heptosyltransferase